MPKTLICASVFFLLVSPTFSAQDEKASKQATQTMMVPDEGLTAFEISMLFKVDRMNKIITSGGSEEEIVEQMAEAVTKTFRAVDKSSVKVLWGGIRGENTYGYVVVVQFDQKKPEDSTDPNRQINSKIYFSPDPETWDPAQGKITSAKDASQLRIARVEMSGNPFWDYFGIFNCEIDSDGKLFSLSSSSQGSSLYTQYSKRWKDGNLIFTQYTTPLNKRYIPVNDLSSLR